MSSSDEHSLLLSVSASLHLANSTGLIRQQHRSVLREFPYTSRNKGFESEFQPLTLVSGPQKPPLRLWDPSPRLPSHSPPPSSSSPFSSLSYYWGWPASQPCAQWPRNPVALTVPVLLAAGRLSLCLPEWPRRNEVPWSHHGKPIVFTLMHTV